MLRRLAQGLREGAVVVSFRDDEPAMPLLASMAISVSWLPVDGGAKALVYIRRAAGGAADSAAGSAYERQEGLQHIVCFLFASTLK